MNNEENVKLLQKLEDEYVKYVSSWGKAPKSFLTNEVTLDKLLIEIKGKYPWVAKSVGQLKEEGSRYRGISIKIEYKISDNEIIAT